MQLLLLISVIWQLVSCILASRHEDQVYFAKGATITKIDYKLKGHVIQTLFSESQIACSHSCLKNSRCQSINYKPPSGTDRGLCELNDSCLSNELGDEETDIEKGFVFAQFSCYKKDGLHGVNDEINSKDLCKDGWTKNKTFCYKFFDELATFYQAKSSCIEGGAELVSIKNLDELRFFKVFLETALRGMADITEEEKSVWMKWSFAIQSTSWQGSGSCLVYAQEQGFQFKPCYENKRYVCKYPFQ